MLATMTEETVMVPAPRSRVQNYRVSKGMFGSYPAGSILPEYAVKQAGDVAKMVKRRLLEPTTDAVNVQIAAPRVAAVTADVSKEMVAESNDLRSERDRLAEVVRSQSAFIASGDRRLADIKDELAKYIEENAHYKRVVADRDAEIADLKKQYENLGLQLVQTQKDLDAATAPTTAVTVPKKK